MLSLEQISLICIILISSKPNLVQGKYVSRPAIQRSIAQYKVISTWENAKRQCDSQGAMLASPIDVDLLKHMKAIIGVNNHTTPYFIGIKARNDGEFVSEEGISLEDISETAIYMIDQIDPRVGDCLCMDQYNIRVVSCWSRLPYMCYKNSTTVSINKSWTGEPTADGTQMPTDVPNTLVDVPIISSDVVDSCGLDNLSGYQLYANRRCYKFHQYGRESWHRANQTCFDEGGYLAVTNDIAEASLIKAIGFSFNPENVFIWIGLYDITGNRKWRSVQGDHLHTIYNVGDLNNSRFDCGAMKYTGKMYDMRCDDAKYFICEKPLPE